MNNSKIVDAMGYIDDELIAASIDYKPHKIKMKWIPYAAAAACAACFCVLAVRIFGKIPGNDAAVSISSGKKSSVTSPVNTQPILDDSVNSNASNIIDESANPLGEEADNSKPEESFNSSGDKPGSKPGDSAASSVEKPGSKPENPVTSSEEKPPFAYLNTKSVTFSTAKEQVNFVDVKEVSGADFIGYELEYIMPSETLLALKYVYVDGEVHVIDNGINVFSPELCEKIESDNMVFWKSLIHETPTVIYISESDVAYFASFEFDANLSKAIDTIKSLI